MATRHYNIDIGGPEGYYYPPGGGAATEEDVRLKCVDCDWETGGILYRELGSGGTIPEQCRQCGGYLDVVADARGHHE